MLEAEFFHAQNHALLLDEVANLSFLSFWSSSRRLRQRYTGNALEVRNSSSGALTNIGFAGESVDSATIISAIGANSGFVRTAYDQTGNGRHLTQTSNSAQPRVRNSGVNDLMGGRIAMQGTGSSFLTLANAGLITGNTATVFIVMSVGINTNGLHNRWLSCWKNGDGLDFNSTGLRLTELSTNNRITATVAGVETNYSIAGNVVVTLIRSGANITVRVNGTTVFTSSAATGNFQIDNVRLFAEGNYVGPGNYITQQITECGFSSQAISISDCQTVERNMGRFYGISVA